MSLKHNERVKLLASGLSSVGVACFAVGFIAPTVSFQFGGLTDSLGRTIALAVLWLGSGFILFVAAQHTLEGLEE